MKIYNILLLIFLLVAGFNQLQAQEEEGGWIEESWLGGKKNAENLYEKLAYYDAIPLYEKLLKKQDDNVLMAHLADCYKNTSNYEKAYEWYNKAVQSGNTDPKYTLALAQAAQSLGKLEEASNAYKNYIQTENSELAQNQIDAIKNNNKFYVNKDRYNLTNLDFNTKTYDFSPVYHNDHLIYASSRDQEKAIGREHSWIGTTFFDLYSAKGDSIQFEKNPDVIKKDAETKFHDAVPTFSPDGTVYLTRNNYFDKKKGKDEQGVTDLKIYQATVESTNKWVDEKEFPYNNDNYSVGHPALTPDGQTMYFVSDMPGGHGGADLYVTHKEGSSWSQPKNLDGLNTDGNEMFPYVDEDGNLYFASNGWPGLGGLDIFKVMSGATSNPTNIGAPINSTYDDFGLTFGKNKSYGYFTSNRPEGKGLDDIWSFTDNGINLEGIVVDAKTGEPICNSSVAMLQNSSVVAGSDTKCDGYFTYPVAINRDYCFNASAEGYATNNSVCASTKNVQPGQTVKVRIPLTKKEETGLLVQVVEKGTQKVIENAKVSIKNNCSERTYNGTSNAQGEQCFIVECGCEYLIVAVAEGYKTVDTKTSSLEKCNQIVSCGNPNVTRVVVELEKDSSNIVDANNGVDGGTIELKDIYYDFDKWNIRPESEVQLNKLLGFLKENPSTIVEIGSHTDSRASYEYNIALSQKRAQSVVNWLISKGIPASRLKAKGYGETQPRNNCTDGVPCSEYEHQRNRRTEFRVIGGSYDIKSLERFDMQIDPCRDCPF